MLWAFIQLICQSAILIIVSLTLAALASYTVDIVSDQELSQEEHY